MDEFDKCRFCKWYLEFEGCTGYMCDNKDAYKPDKARIIEKAKETGISVCDIIALINLK